jgi:FkbM family methyltransferase
MASALKEVLRRWRRRARAVRGRDLWHDAELRRPHVFLGSDYGGWAVLPELITPQSVVYSCGIGDDATWDVAMIERFGVSVHGFDPTPRSVSWVASRELPGRFVFHPVGIAAFDGNCKFVMRNPHPAWSSYNLSDDVGGAYEVAECRVERISTIADRLGHTRIDVLKMDIEGAEYAAIGDMLAGPIRPTQLLIEYHYSDGKASVKKAADSIKSLQEAGYRIFARSAMGYEFGFLRE